jgi:hypothetical protein
LSFFFLCVCVGARGVCGVWCVCWCAAFFCFVFAAGLFRIKEPGTYYCSCSFIGLENEPAIEYTTPEVLIKSW